MTPDLDTRLATVVTALREVVIPALPADEVLAVEQATLCIGQLGVMARQYRHVADYEALCLAEMTGLAASLLAASSEEGPRTRAAADGVRAALDGSSVTPPAQIPASPVQAHRNAIAAAVDSLLRASAVDGSAAFLAASQRAVVDHGARQAARDRAWFAACGMDPDGASLPTIPEMLLEAAR